MRTNNDVIICFFKKMFDNLSLESVKDRIVRIREILSKSKSLKFEELFEEVNREYVVVTFLSILTIARDNEIKIIQKNNFGSIYLERVD